MATLPVHINAAGAKRGAAEFNAATRKMERSAKGAGRVVSQIFVGLGAAAAVRDMIRVTAKFEQSMSTLRSVTGSTGAEMDALISKARELGATTRYSASEATDALVFLARAGFTAEESLAAVGSTLDIATVGMLSLGQAADYASNIVKQFNLIAEDTGRVGDILVTTSNASNTNIQQLAEAMKMAGPIAGALGKSIEETAASVGVLGDSGIQATMAGTNLRGVFAALLGPTDAGKAAFKRMGVALDDVNPASRDLVDIFRALRDGGMEAADALDIFGRRNAAAALILARSAERVDELTEANERSAGAAREAAKIMEDNLAGAFKTLRSTIEEVYLKMGDRGLTGSLRSLVDTGTAATRILFDMASAEEKASGGAQALAVAMKAVGFGALALSAQALGNSLKYIGVVLKAHPIFIVAGVVASAGIAMYQFAGSMTFAEQRMVQFKDEVADTIDQMKGLSDAARGFEHAVKTQNAEKALRKLNQQLSNLDQLSETIFGEAQKGKVLFEDIEQFLGISGISEADVKGAIKPVLDAAVDAMALKFGDKEIWSGQQVWSSILDEQELFGVLDKGRNAIERWIEERKRTPEGAGSLLLTGADGGFGEAVTLTPGNVESLKRVLYDALSVERVPEKVINDLIEEYRQAIKTKKDKWSVPDLKESVEDADLIQAKIDRIAETMGKAATGPVNSFAEKMGQASENFLSFMGGLVEEKDMSKLSAMEEHVARIRKEAEKLARLAGLSGMAVDIAGGVAGGLAEQSWISRHPEKGADLGGGLPRARTSFDDLQDAANSLSSAFDGAAISLRLAEGVGRSFGDATYRLFTDMESTGTQKFQSFLQSLYNTMIETMIATPIENAMKSLMARMLAAMYSSSIASAASPAIASASGNVFSGSGNLVPFAGGGTVSSGPSTFGMGDGRRGLWGEAGPELGFFPLKRNRGKLGITADGGGGGNTTTYQISINTKDADSFRRSKRQIKHQIMDMTRR
jgi:TP901 family phage tail tape measure protein